MWSDGLVLRALTLLTEDRGSDPVTSMAAYSSNCRVPPGLLWLVLTPTHMKYTYTNTSSLTDKAKEQQNKANKYYQPRSPASGPHATISDLG